MYDFRATLPGDLIEAAVIVERQDSNGRLGFMEHLVGQGSVQNFRVTGPCECGQTQDSGEWRWRPRDPYLMQTVGGGIGVGQMRLRQCFAVQGLQGVNGLHARTPIRVREFVEQPLSNHRSEGRSW